MSRARNSLLELPAAAARIDASFPSNAKTGLPKLDVAGSPPGLPLQTINHLAKLAPHRADRHVKFQASTVPSIYGLSAGLRTEVSLDLGPDFCAWIFRMQSS